MNAGQLNESLFIFKYEDRIFSRPKTSVSNNKDSESTCVFRRYSDFETLRNYLVAKYSWVIVPVLPEKTVKNKTELFI